MNENAITWDENDGSKHYNHVEGCPVIPNGYISDKCGGLIKEENDQTAKRDAGKPRLSLVPLEILYDIARVREYAVNGKYKEPNNWKRVEVERYRDAMFRHLCAYIRDPKSVDEESGLPHLWHLATNIAFLCELEKGEN